MEKFPVLDLIIRYGAAGSAVLAVLAGAGICALIWPVWGVLALVPGVFVAAVALLLARSYVELILLITDMLLPR